MKCTNKNVKITEMIETYNVEFITNKVQQFSLRDSSIEYTCASECVMQNGANLSSHMLDTLN